MLIDGLSKVERAETLHVSCVVTASLPLIVYCMAPQHAVMQPAKIEDQSECR